MHLAVRFNEYRERRLKQFLQRGGILQSKIQPGSSFMQDRQPLTAHQHAHDLYRSAVRGIEVKAYPQAGAPAFQRHVCIQGPGPSQVQQARQAIMVMQQQHASLPYRQPAPVTLSP